MQNVTPLPNPTTLFQRLWPVVDVAARLLRAAELEALRQPLRPYGDAVA